MDHKIIDEELDDYKANMRWPDATEDEISLVLANLNGFAARLRSRMIEEANEPVHEPTYTFTVRDRLAERLGAAWAFTFGFRRWARKAR